MKKKAIAFKLFGIFTLLVMPFIHAQKENYIWKYSKEFSVPPDNASAYTLVYDGDFSELYIQSKESGRVGITAEIHFSTGKEKAEKFLKNFRFKTEKDGNEIHIQARHPDIVLLGIGREKTENPVIIIHVQVPPDIKLRLDADFSEIHIDDHKGPVTINSDFSEITAGYLHAPDNRIEGDYLDVISKYIRGVEINSDFSTFQIDLSFDMHISGDYTKFYVKRAKRVNTDGDFIRLTSDRIYRLAGNGDNENIRLKRIYYMNYEGDFNNYQILELAPNFHFIQLKGDYGDIQINNPRKTPYRFIIKLENGRLNANGLEFVVEKISPLTKYYEGFFRDRNAGAIIKIFQSFSTVTIVN